MLAATDPTVRMPAGPAKNLPEAARSELNRHLYSGKQSMRQDHEPSNRSALP